MPLENEKKPNDAPRISYSKPSGYVPPHMRDNPFKIWMWQKVHKFKQGCIIVVSGKMGKGKTTVASSLSEEFDIDANGKTRFLSEEILTEKDQEGQTIQKKVLVPKLVNSLEDFKKLRARKWPQGTAFIIDEGQATINRRDWNSRKNKFFNILMSTGRIFNSFIFITLPFWKVLDSETKLYVDALIDVKGYDPVTRKTHFVPYFLHPGYDEPVYFRVRKKNGRLYKIKGMTQLPPSDSLFIAQRTKTNIFKMAIPQDLVGRDGSYVMPGMSESVSKHESNKEAHEKKAIQWYEKLVDRRDDFKWNNKYSLTKIKRETLESNPVSERIMAKFKEADQKMVFK